MVSDCGVGPRECKKKKTIIKDKHIMEEKSASVRAVILFKYQAQVNVITCRFQNRHCKKQNTYLLTVQLALSPIFFIAALPPDILLILCISSLILVA